MRKKSTQLEAKTPVLEDIHSSNYIQAQSPQMRYHHSMEIRTSDRQDRNDDNRGERTPRGSGGVNVNTIRIIDKELRRQFQGRTNSRTLSVARIKWFENRKSQVLGFCLFIAMFGLTLALYEWRWAGLASGSVLTIVCGSTVVWTYRKKKQWHQHPNPIVHMRSVLSIFLSTCLLCNILIDYKASDFTNRCKELSVLSEFFLITSELWGLMMAVDLFFSLMSPFTNYKRQMKFYHFWVWTIGTSMAIVAWSVEGAAGFFRVDGQKIYNTVSPENLVGFCLASSVQCCEDLDDPACQFENKCESGNFLNAQRWPWVLMYSVVLIVLVVSVIVLILAWHRLYLRGVPKTYHIRLRVLNYVSFFTGAYVFYWLVLTLLYMSAYLVSTKETQDSVDGGIASQILRQAVLFVFASKGYLDFIIWFAVNSIGGRATSNSAGSEDSADVDVDLSPQVNTALRSEILYYTTSGIKHSVNELAKQSSGRHEQEMFLLSTGDPEEKKSAKIRFWAYNPQTFRCIREFFGISDKEYTKLFSATTKERFSEGRSGAFMFYTYDESLIVKTMSKEECQLLRKMTADYGTYLMSHPRSLLTRFYGCHAVSLYGKTYYFVVMGNLFAKTEVIHHRYDIKGSWVDRNARYPRPGDQAICRYCNASYTYGSLRNQECGDGLNFHEPNIVLKDNDLLTKIRIDPNHADTLYDQLCKDSDFLCRKGIMDYSLLMGVQSCEYLVEPGNLTARRNDPRTSGNNAFDHDNATSSNDTFRSMVATSVNGPALYHFGVIDFLQEWNFEKKSERFYKTQILRKDPDGISALPPKPYLLRFQQKMAQIFSVNSMKYNQPMDRLTANYRGRHGGLLDVMDPGNTAGPLTTNGIHSSLRTPDSSMVATPLLRDDSGPDDIDADDEILSHSMDEAALLQ